MKHIKIVLSLLIVVLGMTLAVFGVENAFRDEIIAEAARKANEAKDVVLPGALSYPTAVENMIGEEPLEYETVDIIGVWHFEGLGYVYQVMFSGHANTVEYIFGFDEAGNVTGYQTLKAAETRGEITKSSSWEQFTSKTIADLSVGDIDGWVGATNTTTYWQQSFRDVMDYHNNVILNQETFDVTSEFNNLPDGVTKVERVESNGVALQYIYYVTFQGFVAEDSTFKFAVDASSHNIVSLEILTISDTDGIGSHIADPEFAAQFLGMSKEDATDGQYDDLGGATYPATLKAFKEAFNKVFFWHRDEIEGYVVPEETAEERLYRFHEELSYVEIEFTESTGYSLPSTVTKVEEGDGYVFITAEFTGYAGSQNPVKILVGIDTDTNKLTGMRVIEQNETTGLGGNIENESYLEQFDMMSYILPLFGEFDAITGATITTGGLQTAMAEIAGFYRTEILGLDPLSSGGFDLDAFIVEKAEEMYPTGTQFTDVTSSYPAVHHVDAVYEVKDATNTVLGYVLAGEAEGANIAANPTYLKFVIGINIDRTFAGFRLYDDNETTGIASSYYEAAYSALFISIDIESEEYAIDETSGATYTHDAIMSASRVMAKYFVEEMLGEAFARPSSVPVDNADLLAAYPTAVSFNQVYESYEYNSNIANIYEALDGSNNVIGYVYRGTAPGAYLDVEFTWGVDASGLTQEVHVISHNTSWDDAAEWGDYNGSQTFPNNQTFTPLFEGIQIDSILATQVSIDSWSGVSTTTGGLRTVFEAIAQYHVDNVGGGN